MTLDHFGTTSTTQALFYVYSQRGHIIYFGFANLNNHFHQVLKRNRPACGISVCIYTLCILQNLQKVYALLKDMPMSASGNNNYSSFHYFSYKTNLVGNMRISTMEADTT